MTYFLNDAEIGSNANAALAERPDETRSDRYVFVSTMDILNSFRDVGWDCVRAQQPKSYKSNPQTQQHQLILRSRTLENFEDPRDGHELFPEILIQNSHNGVKLVEFRAGIFAMICTNGLTISTHDFGIWSTRHQGISPDVASKMVSGFTNKISTYMNNIQRMAETSLDKDEQISLATVARDIRWGSDSGVDPALLDNCRRVEDAGNDVWRTFNRVQENAMKGGFKLAKRTARPVKNINLETKLNDSLWAASLAFVSSN